MMLACTWVAHEEKAGNMFCSGHVPVTGFGGRIGSQRTGQKVHVDPVVGASWLLDNAV